jgi:hypothetical protein
MRIVDDRGRLFGRMNLVDLAIGGFALLLVPVAFATFLLFRTPKAQIASVTQVPVSREERRVAGGSSLSSKLKVRGSGLRPMLRATIDSTPALGFVFETPNSADVLVGLMPPGVHDLILWDGVQEVARAAKSVVIQAVPSGRVRAVGSLLDMDRATAESLRTGSRYPDVDSPLAEIAKLGPLQPSRHRMLDPASGGYIDVLVADHWERSAVVLLRCDPDSGEGDCAVSGTSLTGGPRITPGAPEAVTYTRALTIPWPVPLRMTVDEILPSTAPQPVTARVMLYGAPELLGLVTVRDQEPLIDERAATVTAIDKRHEASLTVTLRLGADRSRDGWRYRGRLLRPGAPFSFATESYVASGSVLSVTVPDAAK